MFRHLSISADVCALGPSTKRKLRAMLLALHRNSLACAPQGLPKLGSLPRCPAAVAADAWRLIVHSRSPQDCGACERARCFAQLPAHLPCSCGRGPSHTAWQLCGRRGRPAAGTAAPRSISCSVAAEVWRRRCQPRRRQRPSRRLPPSLDLEDCAGTAASRQRRWLAAAAAKGGRRDAPPQSRFRLSAAAAASAAPHHRTAASAPGAP